MSYDPSAIRDLRKRLKLTQDELADEIGIDRSNVSRWESGITRPHGSAVKLLDKLSQRAAASAERAA